ncbi:MAG: hypothetical protein R6V45_00115, partial [Oceanipulchritudo sp.]
AESYIFGGVWETTRAGEDYDGEQGVLGFGFRQFSGDDQTVYLDNMLIDPTLDWSVSDIATEEPGEPETVYSTGFETEDVGAVTGSDPSEVEGFRPGFAGGTVLDDGTATPFGSENQFLEVSKVDPAGIRTLVHTSAVPSETYLEPALISYDLYDPGTGTGQMLMGLGTGNPWVPEFNDSYMVIGLRIGEEGLSAGINTTNVLGSLPELEAETPYRLYMVTNLSDSPYSFTDPNGENVDLQPDQMEVWLYNYTTESYLFGGVWETTRAGGDYDGEQGVLGFGFRQFSGDDQAVYLDNMLIDSTLDWSVSELDLPDPSEELPWNAEGLQPGDTGYSSWFGSFELSTDDWVNHAELGWLYVGLVDSPDNLWIYSLFLEDWTWSESETFPIVYDVGGERWVYYLILEELGVYVHDYSDGTWTLMP